MRFALLAVLLSTSAFATSLSLQGSTDSLEMVTSTAISVGYTVSWSNVTATALTTPGAAAANVASATTTTIIAAPAASNWRHVRSIQVRNNGATANVVTMQIDSSATNVPLFSTSLAAGEALTWEESGGWRVYNSAGVPRVQSDPPGYSGWTLEFTRNPATALDAIGYHYLLNKDPGFPGAWSVGTPGVNGVVTACDVVGTAGTGGALSLGTHVLPDPATGGWYLTRFGLNAVVVNTYQLIDVLWYNTGLVVTTTTNQAIVSPAFPARDVNGSTNGEGLKIALYALTALGNAATVANTTVSYTNSAGTAGRTATFAASVGRQAPATPVIGTFMFFNLQAGDTGVRSIQGITLATTYTSGTMMLMVYRPIALDGVAVANGPSGSLVSRAQINPGIRVYNDTCFGLAVIGGVATTAPSFNSAVVELMER